MKRSVYGVLLAAICFSMFTVGCETTDSSNTKTSRVKLITPHVVHTSTQWSNQERQQDVVSRSMRVTRYASYHIICVNTSEKPHVHDKHDLVITVLSGSAKIHLGLKTHELTAGDVIQIPRGTLHWVENTGGKTPTEAYAVFTPPYQGKDKRLVNVRGY